MFTTTLKKLLITAAIAAPLALSLGVVASPSSALAASPSSQCAGEYVNNQGTKTCTETDFAGRSGNTKVTETSVKGNTNSSHPESCSYTNPGEKTRDCK